MTNIRFPGFNEMEVIGLFEIHINEGIFLVVRAANVEFSVESHKNSAAQRIGESRRSKLDVVRPLAFSPGEWIGPA